MATFLTAALHHRPPGGQQTVATHTARPATRVPRSPLSRARLATVAMTIEGVVILFVHPEAASPANP